MANFRFVSASKCEKAALRLSKYFNFVGIIEYARQVRNPHDLDMLSQVLSKVGLFMHCDQDDLGLCLSYIDGLAADAYRPRFVKQYNRDCQQFFGDIHVLEFNTPKYSRRNPIVA